MTTVPRRVAIFAAVAATAIVTACSTPLSSGAPTTTAAPATTTTILGADTPAQTKAADLRANLTYLMVEQVYLLSRVTLPLATGVSAPAPGTTKALGADDAVVALDSNSRDLALLLGEAYGPAFGAQFLAAWSARNADFAAYAKAKGSGDTAGAAAATAALATNATNVANVIHAANKYIEVHTVSNPGTGFADELTPENQAIVAFIDAQAAKDGTDIAKVVVAAELTPHTATVLAAAAAKLEPTTYPGTATGTAANLRASLTTALVEHSELISLATQAQATGQDPGAAVAAVGNNTRQLTNIFASIYGDQTGLQFAKLWNVEVNSLMDYAKAKGTSDAQAASTAATQLTNWSADFGTFLATTTAGKYSAGAASADFAGFIDSMENFIDGAATQAPDKVTRLRVATAHMPGIASSLAEAIAEQFPSKYKP
ncbi:MAG: hypothetical protein ACHQNA_07985 [Acidimicrobiales bacterium]